MRLTEAQQGIGMLKFRDDFDHWEAAELPGVGERSFRRWHRRCEEEREAGLLDRRRVGPAGAGGPVQGDRAFVSDALSGARRAAFLRAPGAGPPVCVELQLDEGVPAKPIFRAKAERRGGHRRKRSRRPLRAMMLHQDRSRYGWLAESSPLDLVVTMDDATSDILLGAAGRERGHGYDVSGAAGGVRAEWPAVLSNVRSRRRGGPRRVGPGRTRPSTVPPGNARRRHRSSGGRSANER